MLLKQYDDTVMNHEKTFLNDEEIKWQLLPGITVRNKYKSLISEIYLIMSYSSILMIVTCPTILQ